MVLNLNNKQTINYSVKRYNPSHKTIWNAFVSHSKNGTFLFDRDFMDYHSDRFKDHSLLIFRKENLIAVLPGNIEKNTIHSHKGLTYGGLILKKSLKLSEFIFLFREVLRYLNKKNIHSLVIKNIPTIYCTIPSNELGYLAFVLNAKLLRTDVLSVIDATAEVLKISTIRKRGIKKAAEKKLLLKEESKLGPFWNNILTPNLETTYGKKPVHSLEEIEELRDVFPKNIRQFNIYLNDEIIAGTTIFETKQVAHVQYISANEIGKQSGALDYLFHHLMTVVFKRKKYFDFGISNENEGKNLNEGLLYWKESFGARAISQSFYCFQTKDYENLNHILR